MYKAQLGFFVVLSSRSALDIVDLKLVTFGDQRVCSHDKNFFIAL